MAGYKCYVVIYDGVVQGGGGGGTGGQTNTVGGLSGITNVGDNVDALLQPTYGSASNTFCEGDDARLSDARTPTAHALSHEVGGADLVDHNNLTNLLVGDAHTQYYNKTRLAALRPNRMLVVDPNFTDDDTLGVYNDIPTALARADALVALDPTQFVTVMCATGVHAVTAPLSHNHLVALRFDEWAILDLTGFVGSNLFTCVGTNAIIGFTGGSQLGIPGPANFKWIQVNDTGDARLPLLLLEDCWIADGAGGTSTMLELADGATNKVSCIIDNGKYGFVSSNEAIKLTGNCDLEIGNDVELSTFFCPVIKAYAGSVVTDPTITNRCQFMNSSGVANTIDLSLAGTISSSSSWIMDDLSKLGQPSLDIAEIANALNEDQIYQNSVLPAVPVLADYRLGNALTLLKFKIEDLTSGHAHSGVVDDGHVIDHDDLSNVTSDQHHNEDHASRHSDGGADEIEVEDLAANSTDDERVLKPDGSGGVEFVKKVFGDEFDSALSDGESTTTSGTYQNKLTLTTGVLPAGTYRIGWYCEHKCDDGSNDSSEARVDLDAGTVIAETESMNASPGGFAGGDGHWLSMGGSFITALTNAAHTVEIDFRNAGTANTSRIRRARIEIWRV